MDSKLVRLRKCFQPRQWFVAEGEPEVFAVADEDAFMWVYRKDTEAEGYFKVGYFAPDGTWFTDSSWSSAEAASSRVRYLNGGNES